MSSVEPGYLMDRPGQPVAVSIAFLAHAGSSWRHVSKTIVIQALLILGQYAVYSQTLMTS